MTMTTGIQLPDANLGAYAAPFSAEAKSAFSTARSLVTRLDPVFAGNYVTHATRDRARAQVGEIIHALKMVEKGL